MRREINQATVNAQDLAIQSKAVSSGRRAIESDKIGVLQALTDSFPLSLLVQPLALTTRLTARTSCSMIVLQVLHSTTISACGESASRSMLTDRSEHLHYRAPKAYEGPGCCL